MFTSSVFRRLLQIRSIIKWTTKNLAPFTTQSFNNNVYNAILLKDIESTISEESYDYTATHHTVMEILGCSPGDAINYIESDPDLLRLPAKNLIEIQKICKDNDISITVLKRNLGWITRLKPAELNHKFLYYWKWSFRDESQRPDIIRLLTLNLPTLTSYTCRAMAEKDRIPQGNRISYFSNKLEISVSDSTNMILKCPFLMKRPLELVLEIIDCLCDAGVDPKDIYKDPWSVMYSPAFISDRLEKLKAGNVQHIKPWMLRCKESTFRRCIEIRHLAQEVSQQFNSKQNYLCERLNANPIELSDKEKRYPRVAQISLTKLSKMLDLLLNANLHPRDILRYPEVLTFSPETMEARLTALNEKRVNKIRMSILVKKNKSFEDYLRKFN